MGKHYPVGTIRVWKDGNKYEKKANGEWQIIGSNKTKIEKKNRLRDNESKNINKYLQLNDQKRVLEQKRRDAKTSTGRLKAIRDRNSIIDQQESLAETIIKEEQEKGNQQLISERAELSKQHNLLKDVYSSVVSATSLDPVKNKKSLKMIKEKYNDSKDQLRKYDINVNDNIDDLLHDEGKRDVFYENINRLTSDIRSIDNLKKEAIK